MFRALRRILTLLVLLFAVIGYFSLRRGFTSGNWGGARGSQFNVYALAPVSRSDIISEFKIITVERQYDIPVIGTAYKAMPSLENGGVIGGAIGMLMGGGHRMPGTTEQVVYEMVTTATVGIDMAKLTDADVENSADGTTTITLPVPEVIGLQTDFGRSHIRYRNAPSMPFVDHGGELIGELQRAGERKHKLEAQNDQDLMARARKSAVDSITKLLARTHDGRKVVVRFEDERARERADADARAKAAGVIGPPPKS